METIHAGNFDYIHLLAAPWSNATGLFETIYVNEGAALLLVKHLDRLRNSAVRLGIQVDEAEVSRCLQDVLQRWGRNEGRLRISFYPSGDFYIEVKEFHRDNVAWKFGIDNHPLRHHEQSLRVKSTDYAGFANLLEKAHESGLSDFILVDEDSTVIETTIANLFLINGDEIVTPPLSSGCLPGIVREIICAKHRAIERPISVEDLFQADQIFATNSLRGLMATALVTKSGHTKNFTPSSIIQELQAAFLQYEKAESPG